MLDLLDKIDRRDKYLTRTLPTPKVSTRTKRRRPRNDEELKAYLWKAFRVRIPNVRVCLTHSTPFRAFADAYFALSSVSVWKASRGLGGKSFLLSLLGHCEA